MMPTNDAAAEHARLGDWLRQHVAGFRGGVQMHALAGGQSNPTYRVEAGEHRWVLRKKPPGVLLASAHAVEREYGVMAALADSDVPVPRVHALCEDTSVIGSTFVIMDFVDGRIFSDPSLPGMSDDERQAIYDAMARTLAAIHRVDVAAAGLADYGRPQRYLSRQIERWTRQYRESETEPIDAMEQLIAWLPAHLPQDLDDEPATLVHGDFRIDNLIFHPHESHVLAVIDWELSTLGHPLADLAHHLMAWRVTPEEFRGLKGHDLAALGIPDEAAYLARYLAHGGRAVGAFWDYVMAFNLFHMASILQGIAARASQGNAAAADAVATGARARCIAEAGWRQARQLLAA
jgi:aminoglycoside phosphotransferase (APT) family kinase protein